MPRYQSLKRLFVGLIFVAAMVGLAQARTIALNESQTSVSLSALPREGQQIFALVLKGGPFAGEKDGVVFGNRERLLPIRKRGYYREYTVPTPGLRHRGMRRIVCGGKPKEPDACYYTADHYESFRRITP